MATAKKTPAPAAKKTTSVAKTDKAFLDAMAAKKTAAKKAAPVAKKVPAKKTAAQKSPVVDVLPSVVLISHPGYPKAPIVIDFGLLNVPSSFGGQIVTSHGKVVGDNGGSVSAFSVKVHNKDGSDKKDRVGILKFAMDLAANYGLTIDKTKYVQANWDK